MSFFFVCGFILLFVVVVVVFFLTAPIGAPSSAPTAAPTPTPRCEKDYIFPSVVEFSNISIDCPFGWLGTNVTRYCREDGIWEIVNNDCQLISFTDRFTYWRDELWQYITGDEELYIDTDAGTYTMDGDTNVTFLQTYMGFKLPLRIDFTGYLGSCGGIYFNLMNEYNNSATDISFEYTCSNKLVSYQGTDLYSGGSSWTNNESINGTITYKDNGYVYFYDSINGESIYSDVTPFENDQLRVGLVNYVTEIMRRNRRRLLQTGTIYIQLEEIRATSWMDDFNTSDTMSGIWTDYNGIDWSSGLISSGISDFTIVSNSYQLYIGGGGGNNGYIESDATQFQFTQPLTFRASLLDTTNTSLDFGAMFIFTSTATQSDILEAEGYGIVDNSSFNNITITIAIDDTSVTMTSESNIYGSDVTQENHTCDISTYEVFLTIDISNLNVTMSMYQVTNTTYTECGTEIMLNDINTLDMLQHSNKKWDFVRIQSGPASNNGFTINYVDCLAGIKEDIITEAPTDSPTPAPSSSPTPAPSPIPCPATGNWPSTTGGTYVSVVNSTCKFGFAGAASSVRYCYDYGTWGDVFDDCSKISITDSFSNFSLKFSLWDPWDEANSSVVDDEDVDVSMLWDESREELTPRKGNGNINVVRSNWEIDYPFKLKATMKNVTDECNSWAISIGQGYEEFAQESVRVDWNCDNDEYGVYNNSLRFYRDSCWTAKDGETITVWITFLNNVTNVANNVGCGSSAVNIIASDILQRGNGDWQGYLWFGTFGDNDSVARFSEIEYTQFFTTFDTSGDTRDELWDTSVASKIFTRNDNNDDDDDDDETTYLILTDDESVTSSSYFEFEIPFRMKIGMVRPSANESGAWAHWIALTSDESFVEADTATNKMMLLYDGETSHTRQLITGASTTIGWWDNDTICPGLASNTSSNMNWDEINVEIVIDEETIYVSDDFCSRIIVAEHDLDTKQTSVTLGILPTSEGGFGKIGFSYFEVYQLATYQSDYYDGTPSPTWGYEPDSGDEDTPAPTDEGDDDDDDDDDDGSGIFSDLEAIFQDFLYVVLACIALFILCVGYCLLACCCHWWPCANKNKKKKGKDNKIGQLSSESNLGLTSAASYSGMMNANGSNSNIGTNGVEMQATNAPQHIQHIQPQPPPPQESAASVNKRLLEAQQAQHEAQRQAMQQQQVAMMEQMNQQAMMNQMLMQQMQQQQQQQQAAAFMQQQMMMQSSNSAMNGEVATNEGGLMTTHQLQTNPLLNEGGGGGGAQILPPQPQVMPVSHSPMAVPQGNQNILDTFIERVAIKQIFGVAQAGQDGEKRINSNQARIMVANYRQVPVGSVDNFDPAIRHLDNKTMQELRNLLSDCPPNVFADLEQLNVNGGGGAPPPAAYGGFGDNNNNNNNASLNQEINFLDEFLENVNLKQIFSKLKEDTGNSDPRLDIMHSKIIIANLRDAAFGMIPDNDAGVQLITGHTMNEIRRLLQSLTMRQLRDLDMKKFIAKGGSSGGNNNNNNNNKNNNGGLALGGINNDNIGVPSLHGQANGAASLQLPWIRLTCGGAIQIFRPTKFACFDQLCLFVEDKFSLGKGSYKLMHQDDDGDLIRMASNRDIQESLRLTIESEKKGMKIDVVKVYQD